MWIPLSEFNKMTPKEFNIYLEGYFKRKELEIEDYKTKFELEQKQLIYQAYLISRWVWQKKVKIKEVLKIKEEKRVMTDDEMLQRVKTLNAMFGGKVSTITNTKGTG